jgi:hypothetical protein
MQAWFDAHPGVKMSALSGAVLILWNAVKSALQSAGKAAILTHVINRGGTAQAPTQIAMTTATYIAQWDGIAPNVTTIYGTFPGSISFMGWPQTDVAPDPPVPLTAQQIADALAAAAAKQALQDQWRADAQVNMQLGIQAYQAWAAANPYPV